MAVTMIVFVFMVFVLLRMIMMLVFVLMMLVFVLMMLVFVLMVPVLAMIVPMVMLGGRLPCLPGDQVHATLGATTRLVLDNFRVHGADILYPGVQNRGVEILGGV
jgi:hypothetical protein